MLVFINTVTLCDTASNLKAQWTKSYCLIVAKSQGFELWPKCRRNAGFNQSSPTQIHTNRKAFSHTLFEMVHQQLISRAISRFRPHVKTRQCHKHGNKPQSQNHESHDVLVTQAVTEGKIKKEIRERDRDARESCTRGQP